MASIPQTIPAVAALAAQRWPDRVALQEREQSLTFSELYSQARSLARAFISQGLQAQQRFAIWAPNIIEWVPVALGGMMVGAVVVPLNTRYKGVEAADILLRSGSQLLFTVSGFLDTDYPELLGEHCPENVRQMVLLRGDNENCLSLADFSALGDSVSEESLDSRLAELQPEDLSDIMYTSGTTGKPKGVMSRHGQVVETFLVWSAAINLSEQDRYLIVNPFFHTFGFKAGWVSSLLRGSTAYPAAVFDPVQLLETIEREGITLLPGAPTVFQSLLAEDFSHYKLGSLRCAVTGAASVPEQLVLDMKNKLGFHEVYTGYGLTESGVVSICSADDSLETICNTAGKALPGLEVKVVDEDGTTMAPGELGRIHVRGFTVMLGYFEDPAATSAAIDGDGWLDTGDIGWCNDQGYIKITDRAKDMYISGGFNCYPAEIENLMLLHDDIADVAVIGIEDERMGEVGHAFVVARPGAEIKENELRNWCKATMANYKVPKKISPLADLPRNASGKVQKFLLAN